MIYRLYCPEIIYIKLPEISLVLGCKGLIHATHLSRSKFLGSLWPRGPPDLRVAGFNDIDHDITKLTRGMGWGKWMGESEHKQSLDIY
ncbi:hypothetical protein BDD12DRAFT_846504 [Trichophaea hybrida]|nr:hypothetical protein BDD12DRAFT_846504 [Trichophaea hybrida]